MKYKVITPASAVITLADLREHLRVDGVNAPQDALIEQQLEAARDYCQHYTGRAIGLQTLEIALDAFPGAAIALDPGPAISITSIKYINPAGTEVTLSNSLYALDDYGLQHWALPAAGTLWPGTLDVANAVKVRYQAGNLLPAARSALLLMVGHLFANREETVPKDTAQLPLGVHALLDTFKSWSA